MFQSNQNFILSYDNRAYTIFYLNFIVFVHAGHANFKFNQFSIFTECCF